MWRINFIGSPTPPTNIADDNVNSNHNGAFHQESCEGVVCGSFLCCQQLPEKTRTGDNNKIIPQVSYRFRQKRTQLTVPFFEGIVTGIEGECLRPEVEDMVVIKMYKYIHSPPE